jgi:hypothetical protein
MPDDMRDLWRQQDVEPISFTVEEIRGKARRLRSRVRWRNLREYAVGAVLIGVQGWGAWTHRGGMRIADILLLAGMACVMYQLHRRASPGALRADSGLRGSVDSYRRELERQRDALDSVWLWYELPFAPGLAAVFVTTAARRGVDAAYFAGLALVIAVFVAVWSLNHFAARRLDAQIRELEHLEENDE